MNGILALGHFCETHGPCIILCTQSIQYPQLAPHLLTVQVCDACKSINLDQAFVSYSENANYVTTRVPLKQDVAFLLKQACIRSLSCEEETSKDGGTVFFGDNERGHVLSHTFLLQDSLARGFHRKFTLLMLMRDKVHLLNAWPFLTAHMRQLEGYLRENATSVNIAEQAQCPQRAFRQVQGGTGAVRSLAQLTGTPAIFGHVHLWFCWMLNAETVTERFQLNNSVQTAPGTLPPAKNARHLRNLARILPADVFNELAFCVATGVGVTSPLEEAGSVLETFKLLLPTAWRDSERIFREESACAVLDKTDNGTWIVKRSGNVPGKMPTLIARVFRCLRDENLPDAALEPQLEVLVMEWFNISQSLVWSGGKLDQGLLQSLGVQSYDISLVKYWMTQIK